MASNARVLGLSGSGLCGHCSRARPNDFPSSRVSRSRSPNSQRRTPMRNVSPKSRTFLTRPAQNQLEQHRETTYNYYSHPEQEVQSPKREPDISAPAAGQSDDPAYSQTLQKLLRYPTLFDPIRKPRHPLVSFPYDAFFLLLLDSRS